MRDNSFCLLFIFGCPSYARINEEWNWSGQANKFIEIVCYQLIAIFALIAVLSHTYLQTFDFFWFQVTEYRLFAFAVFLCQRVFFSMSSYSVACYQLLFDFVIFQHSYMISIIREPPKPKHTIKMKRNKDVNANTLHLVLVVRDPRKEALAGIVLLQKFNCLLFFHMQLLWID